MSAERAEWIGHALNGSSYRAASPWKGTVPGDILAGTVVVRSVSRPSRFDDGQPYLDVKVEFGVMGGEPLTPGAWYRLYCKHAVLSSWIDRDEPVPGDKVAIEFLGREAFSDGTTRLLYAAGVAGKTEDSIALAGAGIETAPWE